MDVVVENLSAVRRKLTITLPEKDVKKDLDKAYDKLRNEVNLKGFRRGKVPRQVLERNFRAQVEANVIEDLIQATYFDAIEQEKIDTVVHPEIKSHVMNQDGTMTYVAEVDIRPEFELKEYKNITVEKPSVQVTDAEVDAEIEKLRRQNSVLRTADEGYAIAMDDVAVIDFQGFDNGEAMKEVRNENYSVDVGSERLGKEFEEKLVGMKKGDKTLHEVEFPADYPNPILAGKKVEFKIDVRDIKQRVKPELDDEFAKDVDAECQTLDALRASVRTRLQQAKEEALEGDLADRLVSKLIESHDFEIPERLVRFEVEEMIKQTESTLQKSGLSLEAAGINREEMAERNRPLAEKRVRGDFILKKIAEKEEIKLADEDMERGYQRIADQYNMQVPEVKKYFQRRDELMPFMHELLNEKILAFLRENANFVEQNLEGKEETSAESAE